MLKIPEHELRERLDNLDRLAHLMDEAFRIPGTNIRFGIDNIVGLLPAVGDAIPLLTHGYLVAQAIRIGARKRTHARMFANAFIDMTLGVIPIVGDAFDVFWKSNRRNVELLRREISHLLDQPSK
jgi:hypothetical protein